MKVKNNIKPTLCQDSPYFKAHQIWEKTRKSRSTPSSWRGSKHV